MTTMTLSGKGTMNLTQTTNKVVCAVCQKYKHQLRPRKSKLNPGMQMYLCNDCFNGKYEPRWLIILVGQSQGLDAVKNYLLNKQYVGAEILASDLIK